MTLLRSVAGWRRAASTALTAAAVAVALMFGSTPATASADVLDELAQEFTTSAGGGQVANLLHESLKLRSMGFKPTKAQLDSIQDALRYRPNQKPLISALEETIAAQTTKMQQAEAIAQKQGPYTIGINQYDPSSPGGVTVGRDGINIGGGGYTIGNGRRRSDRRRRLIGCSTRNS